jgi:hypothetical protein
VIQLPNRLAGDIIANSINRKGNGTITDNTRKEKKERPLSMSAHSVFKLLLSVWLCHGAATDLPCDLTGPRIWGIRAL